MFKPVLIGGQDISSLRAHFDIDDKNVVLASNRQILYYDVRTGLQNGTAHIPGAKLAAQETVAACEKIEDRLYLITDHGTIFIWCLETRDWLNQLSLPIDPEAECLISCRMLSKRQYVFSTRDKKTQDIKLFYSSSRSERERPKQWELIGACSNGDQTAFDIGCCVSREELEQANKTTREKLTKLRVLAFINKHKIHFQKLGVGAKLELKLDQAKIANHLFTCVRANPKVPMVAAGDAHGRIYLYTGDFNNENRFDNRTKLHWHGLAVSDLCFSSTGNTLYSVGSESGCVVIWDLSSNHLGQKKVIAGLGMPLRHINSSENLQQLIISSEDNELVFMDTDHLTIPMKTMTRRTYDIYLNNDVKAMRFDRPEDKQYKTAKSIGLLWHSKTDTLVTNQKTGKLQFYSAQKRTVVETLDGLRARILSIDWEGRVLPSEITIAAFSSDGDWLAFYETRDPENGLFPDVRLHLFQRSSTLGHWSWIQTADRLHPTANIADLKFSPDGQYLVSLACDGSFHILYKINLDAKSNTKQMYAKGFFSNVPENLASRVAFSQDSSVLAISLKNETTLIWMIVDPYKLEYECQLSRDGSENLDIPSVVENNNPDVQQLSQDVLGLHFGHYEPPGSVAPLCEIRPKYIRTWNILKAQSNSGEMMTEYLASDAPSSDTDGDPNDEFTAAAFEQSVGSDKVLDHFAVSTKRNLVYIFELKIENSRPLIVIDASLTQCSLKWPRYFTDICFVGKPILEIDEQCHEDPLLLKLVNRLCLMTNQQELVSFSDKLTLERQSAVNNCNEIKSYDPSELSAYFSKSASIYREELRDNNSQDLKSTPQMMTEKQRKIKHKLQVQRMLNDLFQKDTIAQSTPDGLVGSDDIRQASNKLSAEVSKNQLLRI